MLTTAREERPDVASFFGGTFVQLVVAILKAAAVFLGAAYLVDAFKTDLLIDDPVDNQIVLKLLILFGAIAVGLIFGRSLAELGFGQPRKARVWHLVLGGLVAGAITSGVILHFGLPKNPVIASFGLPAFIIVIVGLSSVSEEILCRGLLQADLERAFAPEARFLGLSAPVWVSGLFFGAMHMGLFRAVAAETVFATLAFTTTVGLLAARAREKTGGLGAPIAVHVFGNLGGIAGGIIYMIATRAAAG